MSERSAAEPRGVELIERTWAALARGEHDVLEHVLASDARWEGVEPEWVCEGRAAIIERMRAARAHGPPATIEQAIARGERVLVAFRPPRPPQGPRPLEDGLAWVVVTVRDGAIIELKGCADKSQALDYADGADPSPGGFASDRPRPDGRDVRRVRSEDVPKVARALAEAFFDDPHFRWIVGEDAKRIGRLERGFDTFTRRIWLRHGECYTHELLFGAAIWLPPGTWHQGPLEQLRLLPAIAANLRRDLPRFLRALTFIESKHPREPDHWYLPVLGVAPPWQGRGFGAALLQPVLARCDADGTPAYLEASTARNRLLYERHGFALLEECRYAPAAPPLWRMWREPRR